MERHRCKLCLKKFANGRALGGHMKFHMLNHEHEDEVEFATRGDDEFIVVEPTGSSSLVTLQDRESGRNKSSGSSAVDVEADPPGSSITEVTSDEDLAFCLMMMSRDKWNSSVGFRSYQALGGHRASHKKLRVNESEQSADYTNEDENRVDDGLDSMIKKVHECPICLRVFASGQALGGHKRSHVIVSNNGVDHNNNLLDNSKITKIITRDSLIDLNLPASVEDEDEDDSAVSDVHF
uniref:C2H2-type domain-containing protein n=1 Tax=Chenopodium quinoa TaxID=63459 RepID=A0A803KYQ0_CHEQI